MRYLMDVIPLDANLVGGSHGLLPATPQQMPIFCCSEPLDVPADPIPMTAVKDLIVKIMVEG